MSYSERNYIRPGELPTYIHTMSGVTNSGQAAQFISDAEAIVDRLVGGAPKFYPELTGDLASAVASGATTWPSNVFGSRRTNYWAKGGVYVEIQECTTGSLVGQKRLVVGSTDNQVTLASGFDAPVPVGTQFGFRQESLFPRAQDYNVRGDPRMPDDLKRAVAYQVEFAINEGSEAYGLSDPTIASDPDRGIQSRSYGSGYSETRVTTEQRGLATYVAPKARVILRRLMSSTGRLVT